MSRTLSQRFPATAWGAALILILAPYFTPRAEADTPPKFIVLVTEQIDVEKYWYFYTVESQHVVQGAIEKALINGGFEVVDIAGASETMADKGLDVIASISGASGIARALGATHIIMGHATATFAGRSVAHGVDVHRSEASVAVRIVRVADGRVVAVEDASSRAGGEAQRSAGQTALRDLGKTISEKVAQAARKMTPDAASESP